MSNSMGVVDESYCGDEDEWKMPVYATRDCRIEANDRIASSVSRSTSLPLNLRSANRLAIPPAAVFGSTGKQ